MLETLRCPSCSTRFGLRASRVHARIRRARCFRCDTVFGIEEAVARLLAPSSVEAVPAPAEEAEWKPAAGIPAPAPEPLEPPSETAPEAAQPSLDPGDLEPSGDPSEEGAGNFSSAKDAIAKLMGAAPAPSVQPKHLGSRGSMDVEATLDALDSTLGGSPALPPAPAAPAPAPASMASTLKLTADEIQAALAAGGPARIPVQPTPRVDPASVTTHAHPILPVPSAPSQDLNLLKVQLEQETCHNVTLEQMGAWIEQGRVQEYHMVARQFSDNWIEASKVPALRPLFDQRRRLQAGTPEEPPAPPAEVAPVKRGLFGGLFSRN